MPRPTSWPASFWASVVLHSLIGLYCANVARLTLVLQTLDLPQDGTATPWTSLSFILTMAAGISAVLLVANLVAGRASAWTSRSFYLMPPLVTFVLTALGGLVGTLQFMRGWG